MKKNASFLIFFSIFLASCHSNLTSDSLISKSTDSFTFKITPGKAKTPTSIMPTGFGPIRGPSISSSGVENSFSKDLIRCRKNLLNQQVHFVFNF
ncbi:MAG: hypothetical protein E6K54_00185 [Gammaproteobacteria bacterium]|nr:MAG: hypothetical protein E6K54_00185 [Gammaproteobacteria bacterium]